MRKEVCYSCTCSKDGPEIESSSYKERVEEVVVVCGKQCSEVPEPLPNRNTGETEITVLCIEGTTTNLWEGFYNMVHAAD